MNLIASIMAGTFIATVILGARADFVRPAGDWAIPADVVEVYDGDTIRVDAHPWPDMTIRVSIRIDGIDTPEIHGKCDDEINRAKAAKEFLTRAAGDHVTILNPRPGKFARRMLADVLIPTGEDVASLMINNGFAREYHGEHRAGWCG